MDDLVTWLRAQIDEDERSAQTELDLLRDYPYPDDFRIEYRWVRMAHHPHGGVSTTFAPGSPSPSQVLAEVTAKRQRIDWLINREHDMGGEDFPTYDTCRILVNPGELGDLEVGYCSCGLDAWRDQLWRFEALPYEKRSGYRGEWKP